MSIRTLEDLETIAQKRHWQLNPNLKMRESILIRLNRNYEKLGYFACPCKPTEVNKTEMVNGMKIFISECPCLNAEREIEQNGHCHCNLFFKH